MKIRAPITKSAKWLAVTCLYLAASSVHADGANVSSTREVSVPRVSQAPRIADFLDTSARQSEAAIRDFRQREPNDGQAATLETTVYLSFDDKNFYAAFVCKSDPGKVRAHMSKREDTSGDDLVSLSLDTFHDGRRAYVFYANPLGVQLDAITTEGQRDDYSWDALWFSEGRLTPNGYVVLLTIPFKSLRFSSAPGSSWGVALTRYIPARDELDTWPHLTQRVEAWVPQFASLSGVEKVSPTRNMQFIPYGFFSSQRFLDLPASGSPRILRKTEWRGGLDSKFILRDAFTLDLTMNPDFSQVESNEPQVTINQRYEVFFPEKRPFFTESAGFFDTPETLFFSRRVRDPQFGARFTGKAGGWAIGALAMDDRAPGRLLSAGLPHFGDHARIGVARVLRELPGHSNFGVMFTRRQFGSGLNQIFSMDTRLKLNANWVLTAQAIRSRWQDGASHATGSALYAQIEHVGRHFTYYTNYKDRSPDFRTDLGFIPRVDIRQVKNLVFYKWRPESGALVSFGPALVTLLNWTRQGRLQDRYVDAPFYLNFRGETSLSFGRTEAFELFENRGFRKHDSYLNFSTDRWNWLGFDAAYSQGLSVNYFPAPGIAPFSARSSEASFGMKLRPTSRLRLKESYIFERLGTVGAFPATGSPKAVAIFNNHIFRTTANYQFTRALSLRAIVDYNAVLANPTLVDLERSKRMAYDVLLAYTPHPGTAVYLGYSDAYDNMRLDPTDPLGLRRTRVPGFSTGRQVFIKISYLFRF